MTFIILKSFALLVLVSTECFYSEFTSQWLSTTPKTQPLEMTAITSPSSLTGRTYIVTGGASGIGLATVKKLLNLSATVHVLDRAPNPPEITGGSGKVYFYPGIDVGSRAVVAEAFKSIYDQTSEIHGLVNAAGVSPSGNYALEGEGWAMEKDSTYDHVMDVNVRGTWNTTCELLSYAVSSGKIPGKDKGGMSIVNVGSLAAVRGVPTMAAYTASKHAVLGLTRTWGLEYAQQGIRVNLVSPGLIRTPLGMGAVEGDDARAEAAKSIIAGIPLKRVGEPEEIAGPIVFLLSDDSSYMTGNDLHVGGGLF